MRIGRLAAAGIGSALVFTAGWLLALYLFAEEGPGTGTVQRLPALVVFAWIAVVAHRLDRAPPPEVTSSGRRPRREPRRPMPRGRAAPPR